MSLVTEKNVHIVAEKSLTEKNVHIVAEKSLTEKCPYVLYKSERRKTEKLKKEGKMRTSIFIFITQYSLPT